MTKTFRCGVAAIATFAAMGTAAQAQDTASADASAEVLDALVLTNNGSLDFGAMVVSGAGTVSLDAANALTCTDTDIVCSGTTSVAAFDVEGTANKAVTINLPTGTINLRHPNYNASTSTGEHTIELGSLVSSDNNATSGDPEVTLDGTGDASFTVGGTITIDGSEEAGLFEGSFDVSVEYS